MRVISRKALRECWERHADVESRLKSWFAEMRNGTFRTPDAIKKKYSSADFIAGNRVVFNIKGNHYRLVAKINDDAQVVYIRFVGTHKEYDKIDAETI